MAKRSSPVMGTITLDVSDCERVVDTLGRAGPFDVLVNNAGTNRPASFLEVSAEDYDAVFALNVRAAFFVGQVVARGMIAAKRFGSIINVWSQMGHVGGPSRTVYCATEQAIEGLIKAMAAEFGPKGLRVNSLCPTFIETPMITPFLADPESRTFASAKIKLGRLGRLDDVVGGLVFLASGASALMTGSALMLDGDRTRTSRLFSDLGQASWIIAKRSSSSSVSRNRRWTSCQSGTTSRSRC